MPRLTPEQLAKLEERIKLEKAELDGSLVHRAIIYAMADRFGIPRNMFLQEVRAMFRKL